MLLFSIYAWLRSDPETILRQAQDMVQEDSPPPELASRGNSSKLLTNKLSNPFASHILSMKRSTTFHLLFLLLLCISSPTYGGETVHVVTHDRVTIVTDPSHGFNLYKRWGVFPSPSVPMRRIALHVWFACPESLRCADWDYLDHVTIRRTGGVNGPLEDYEIGRMLTPYGGAFGKDWHFEWEVDVTDFSLLLQIGRASCRERV